MFEKLKNSQRLRSGLFLILFVLFFIITIGLTANINNNSHNYTKQNSDPEETDIYAPLVHNNYHYTYSLSINGDNYQVDGYKYGDLFKETYNKNEVSINNIDAITPYYNFTNLTNLKKLTEEQYLKNSDLNTNIITQTYQIANKDINIILLSESLNDIIVNAISNTSLQIVLTLDNYFSEIYNGNYQVKISIVYDQFNMITENMMQ